MPENLPGSNRAASPRERENGSAAPLSHLLKEMAPGKFPQGEPGAAAVSRGGAGSFQDLFEGLREAAPDGDAGFKQFITNLGDRVPVDWEGLLHGRKWEDLAIAEIEDGIVLGIFHKAHEPLPEEGRRKFAREWSEGGGAGAMLGALTSGDAKALRKLDAPQLALLRRLTWELSETGAIGGAIGAASEIASTGRSVISNNVEVSGVIKFRGELVFGGRLKTGSIAGDILVVEKDASIEGEVSVESLKLSGKVAGNVTAARKCELGASAELIGDLTTQRLSMEEGATLVGQVRLGRHPPGGGRMTNDEIRKNDQ